MRGAGGGSPPPDPGVPFPTREKGAKARRGCPPGPPNFTGVFRGHSASEELPCPVNGPHLLALHTGLGASETAARLDKAALASPELSFGSAE